MTKTYPYIIEKIEDWPISQFGKKRDIFIEELNNFTLERVLAKHEDDLQSLLEKCVYLEKIRSKKNPWKVDPPDEKVYWTKLATEVKEASLKEHKQEIYLSILKRIINRYSEEIVGHFNPKTFKFSKKFVGSFFKRLLNTAAGRNHRRVWGNKHQLREKLKVRGKVEEARELFNRGTVVIVPTHFSNLDSILVGYAVDETAGMPAFSFGAGLNLYDVELVGYFMNRLGAYRVDRRKKNPIYLESLKAMACHSLQKGINNIFFPGGTRSRDGSMEARLKLGLLGSVVESQRLSIQQNQNNKIFVIPLIIGYHFVLEGKFLIDQHLQKTGKEKYVRSKDQFKSYRKIWKFIWSLFSEKSEITLSFGEPMDVLGNLVDFQGNSVDKNGNPIDIKSYFELDGRIKENAQRESIYTKILGQKILESYYRNNVVLSSHLVAFAAFRTLLMDYRTNDIFAVLNIPTEEYYIDPKTFEVLIGQLQEILIDWKAKGKIKLSPEIELETKELIKDGIDNLGIYHIQKPLKFNRYGSIVSDDFKLLYFYHNRMINYDLEKFVNWKALNKTEPEPLKIN